MAILKDISCQVLGVDRYRRACPDVSRCGGRRYLHGTAARFARTRAFFVEQFAAIDRFARMLSCDFHMIRGCLVRIATKPLPAAPPRRAELALHRKGAYAREGEGSCFYFKPADSVYRGALA